MHQIVLLDTKLVVEKARFVFFYVDEVTNVDYQSWLVVCVYIVDCWKCMLILLTLEQVVKGDTTNNFTKVIMGIVLQFGGLLESNLVSKFISFDAGWILCFLWIKN